MGLFFDETPKLEPAAPAKKGRPVLTAAAQSSPVLAPACAATPRPDHYQPTPKETPTIGRTLPMLDGVRGRAVFADNGMTRLELWREWHDAPASRAGMLNRFDEPYACFIGMNPSGAGGECDDKTIRNDIAFTNRLGLKRLCKVNLFPLISTSPEGLDDSKLERYVFGHVDNSLVLRLRACSARIAIAAWGCLKGRQLEYAREITRCILGGGHDLYCYGTTQDGSPRHTSRLAHDTELVRWHGYR